MNDYNNNLRGVLFKNAEKRDEKDRDYQGHCEIDGRKYWLSAWINTSKGGAKYMALRLKAADDAPPAPAAAPAASENLGDDDIPF